MHHPICLSSSLLLSLLLAPLAALAVAIPDPANANTPATINQQPLSCFNAPGHKVGTPLNRRTALLPPPTHPLSPRALSTPPTTTYCAAHSSTYFIITYLGAMPLGDLVSPQQFLLLVHDLLVLLSKSNSDASALVPQNRFEHHQGAMMLELQGKGLTYAVAERVAQGLYEYESGWLAQGGGGGAGGGGGV
ncbi:MAG: hypothetical protein FRX48_02013 [Lasallia pustulata]|uniref:Uncharacterized protein n=1 Tax=Lasallia pustulata TaxID=136370 RepID=A0A5M8PXH4_9LECA|nr:MAG: hypothetical protein FRX48_02013 [Lasallia pustulata]